MDQAVSRALRDLRVWDTLSQTNAKRWLAPLRRSFHRLFSSLGSKPTRLVPSSITSPALNGKIRLGHRPAHLPSFQGVRQPLAMIPRSARCPARSSFGVDGLLGG